MTLHELRENMHSPHPAGESAFVRSYDIIVVGLGTAGAFCAIAAAGEGAHVLGIERSKCAGGMCTLGSVNNYYYGVQGGLYEETDRICRKMTDVFPRFGAFHPDAKKIVLESQISEAGVDTCYDSCILGIYEENGAVKGVRALCGGKTQDIGCTLLVDGTSDGHLIRMLGVPTSLGRKTDGKTQPFTSVRVFLREDGSLGRTNFDSGYVNQYQDEELSQAIIDAHSHHAAAEVLKNGERFLYAAPMIGIREGLNFQGEERLTLEDILEQREFSSVLCYAYSDIDKHGVDLALDEPLYQDWLMLSNLCTVTARIPIALGCTVPKGYAGLMSTGRCLSMDSYAASAVRMNRDMHRLGQACGITAAMALKTGGRVMDIDGKRLRQKLIEQNCFDLPSNRRIGFDNSRNPNDYTPVEWMDIEKPGGTEAIRAVLSTDCPGVALWSCRRLGKEKAGDALCKMIEEGDEMLRANAAVALGLTGDLRSLPVLRELVRNRSAFFYKDCQRCNQLRSAIAICLCGRLDGEEIVPELLQMLKPEEFERPLYHEWTEPSRKFGIRRDFNQVYYQHFSNAAIALTAIACREPALFLPIRSSLEEALQDLQYIRRITPNGADTSEYKACANIWKLVQLRLG